MPDIRINNMIEFLQNRGESEEERLVRMARFMGLEDLLMPQQSFQIDMVESLLQTKVKLIGLHIERQCRAFVESRGLELSSNAKELLKLIITAVVTDPHPQWKIGAEEIDNVMSKYIEALPHFLNQLAEDEDVQEQITTFDILHWVSRHRDMAGICIIEK